MIKITVSDEGVPLVWDSKDWFTLRKDHRIIGNLLGSHFRFPSQDVLCGLPIVLFPYEATLLKEKKIAQLVRYPSLSRAPGKGVKEAYEKYREKLIKEQLEYLQNQVPGNDVVPDEDSSFTSSQRSSACNENAMHTNIDSIAECTSVQLFTTYPWLRAEDACSVKWHYPSTALEALCFNVYKDLWGKGYYVSSGQSFGGDFMVYPGDPFITRAHFLIVCVDQNAVIRPVDIAVLCRLSDTLKKSVVLASESCDNQIIYQSLRCCNVCK